MSRIIVKNIPKFITEKELTEHFKDLGVITDCKVLKDEKGQSRKFGFLGFKDPNAALLAKKNYNKTFLGVSKVLVEIAKTRDDQEREELARSNKQRDPIKKGKKEKQNEKANEERFKQYKKIVEEGVKKSWDDLVMPQQAVEDEGEEVGEGEKKKASKKEKKVEKRNEKENLQKESSYKKRNNEVDEGEGEGINPIKAPKLSEKNKKYVSKALSIDETRLYITNIPYQITEDQIQATFSKFGSIKKIKLPVQYDGKTKGYAFVTYQSSAEAMRAFSETNNKVIFGRILHVKPAVEDIGSIIKNAKEAEFEEMIKEKYGEAEEEKTSFKKKKKKEMREKLNDTTSWNTLFLNPNTILERMSEKLGTTKSQILLSENLAPKIALAEVEVIQQTKQWMISTGLNVEFLQIDRNLCERSKKVILIKNLNYKTQESDLQELFQFYGIINKLLLSPNRAIAIVEYQTKQFAENALEKLQNFKFKNNFIYLEYAPVGMMKEQDISEKINKMEEEIAEAEEISKVIYIKNLNFETTETSLTEFLAKVDTPKSVKIIRDSRNNNKSMGYGFAEFQTKEIALKVIKQLQSQLLDNHRLMLSISKKNLETQKFEKIKELKEKISKEEKVSNKLIVRNLAFQATKPEIRELFKYFGNIKVIRLPKKMDGQHRGFGFVEYDTADAAALAKQALSSSHLYGRKLVIEYEKGSQENNAK